MVKRCVIVEIRSIDSGLIKQVVCPAVYCDDGEEAFDKMVQEAVAQVHNSFYGWIDANQPENWIKKWQ